MSRRPAGRIVNTGGQRSPEWFAARLGRLSSSHAKAMLAKGRGEAEAQSVVTLRQDLVAERRSGCPTNRSYATVAMLRGIVKEPDARFRYECETGDLVRQVDYVEHHEAALLAGASPDGLVGNRLTIVELKAPSTTKHLRNYARAKRGELPDSEYFPQLRHLAWCLGGDVQQGDVVSFDDRLTRFEEQVAITRVPIEALDLEAYDTIARRFLESVEEQMADLEALTDE